MVLVIKMISGIIRFIINKIISLINYFGLGIPIIYTAYTLTIFFIFKINILNMGYYAIFFYTGLIISITCSFIITLKHFISEGDNIDKDNVRITAINPKKMDDKNKKVNRFAIDNHGYYQPHREDIQSEIPLVYRHKKYKGIVCLEYTNKIEYYGEQGNKLIYLRSQAKTSARV